MYFISGDEGDNIVYKTCCYPIPGDPILGLYAKDGLIKVHRQGCARIKKRLVKESKECIEMVWANDIQGIFSVPLQAKIVNERGVLATLTLAVADLMCQINAIRMGETDGRFTTVTMLITVRNTAHLSRVVRAVDRLSTVSSVERVYDAR